MLSKAMKLAAQAQKQHQNDTQIVPQRGSILDVNLTLLATAEYLADVEAAPNQIRGSGRSAQAVASELGQVLGVPPEQLAALLNQPDKTYTLLAKGVTPNISDKHQSTETERQSSRHHAKLHALPHLPVWHACRPRRGVLQPERQRPIRNRRAL